MAKGKGKGGGGSSGGVGSGGGGPVLAATQSQKSLIPLFPPRPARPPNAKAPGQTVILISNLFKMSIVQQKPIYKVTVTVDIELPTDGDEGGERAVKPKLNQELRRQAVDLAIKNWIKAENPRDYNQNFQYNYLFDSNGSVVYSLFDLFPRKEVVDHEFKITLNLDDIKDFKLVKKPKNFRVKMFQAPPLDMRELFEYTTGRGNQDIAIIQEHMRALNVIMRGKICTISTNVMTPYNIFPFTPKHQFQVSPCVIANKGYSLSVRPGQNVVMLNVSNTVAAFLESVGLLQMLQNRFRINDLSRALNRDTIEKLKKEIYNKQVEAHHINYGTNQRPHYRKYRVTDVSGSALDKFTLVDKETKTSTSITIADYFQRTYNVRLKYPHLPCIVDKGRKVPLEVCYLVEKQRVLRKMDPEETAEIIKKAAQPPLKHFDDVIHNAQEVKKQAQPLQEFGLTFDPTPIEVEGRELHPITLVAGLKRELMPKNGGYMSNGPFFRPTKVAKWAMLFLKDSQVDFDFNRNQTFHQDKFSNLYCGSAKFVGVHCAPIETANSQSVQVPEADLKKFLKGAFAYLNNNKFEHVIIVLPKRCPDWVYRYIQYLEVTVGPGRAANERWTRSSCIKYDNYMSKIINGRDNGRMFLSNLWLKYNTKFGGINFVLKDQSKEVYYNFLQEGYIFISIDVCHPAPGDKLSQSVAAAVGMWDLTNDKMSFCTRLKVQKKMREDQSTIEEVGEIGVMVGEIFESFKAKKGKYPTKIVILRDGVSEGQFRIVLEKELCRVKQILQNKYTNVKQAVAPMTCLVVQKRHKVRFIRKTPYKTQKGDDFNIQPGTVVDNKVVHPTDFSFYLAPHKAIQGTSRAAHIYIILDEIKFSQDQAQAMVHALSYLSPRCTKSTSIPTPVNLADLAAERGKNIVISWNEDHPGLNENKRLEELNKQLNNLAETGYKDTLYYI